MPAILERIKSTVRGRSRSRGSKDENDILQHRSSEEVPKTPTVPSQFQNFSRPSLENSAFHVTPGRGVRQSLDNDPFQQRVAETNTEPSLPRRSDVGPPRNDAKVGDMVPNRTSSRVVIQNRPQSHHADQRSDMLNGSASPQTANLGSDSRTTRGVLAQNPVGSSNAEKGYPYTDNTVTSSRKSNEAASTPTRKAIATPSTPLKSDNMPSFTDREARQTPNGSLPIRRLSSPEGAVRRKPVPTTQPRTSQPVSAGSDHMENERLKQSLLASGHLKLPEGFDLNNTEQTHVTEYQRPAVTHETIIKQRTEILQEAITRDIHYHHYYTYLQPIKVVEVLPPRHYFLNHETGEKTEITAPPGWTMPTSTTPISPDYTGVGGWTRHYLVNEEHPNGVLESPPLKHEGDVGNLRKVAQQQAY